MEKEKVFAYKYLTVFLMIAGFVGGCILYLVDRWLDDNHYTFLFSWIIAIFTCMLFGGLLGEFLQKEFKEQRERENAIQREHNRLYELFNALPGIVYIQEKNYIIRFANHNFTKEFGDYIGKSCYETLLGRNIPCDKCLAGEAYCGAQPLTNYFNNRLYEVRWQTFDDVDGSQLIIKVLNDITERKLAEQELSRLQAEMARLERLNLVGQMAAGIAHEIRNPMTTVRGYLQLLGSRTEFQSQGSTFELMIEELDRANSIITEFLSFVKNGPTERRCQSINQILCHLYPLLEADTFSQNKQIVFEAGETLDILLDSKEISQLVLNFCRNGLDAMQAGGTLRIRTYIEDEQVVLSVEDEGCGIHSEFLDKLGIPFHTTKENGTGLGLAICYSIANKHNAKIDFKSGFSGTTFFVRFPCLVEGQ